MAKRPEWAYVKVQFYLSTCWMSDIDDCPYMMGINWFLEGLFWVSVWIHQHLVAPFCQKGDEAFPFWVLEVYERD